MNLSHIARHSRKLLLVAACALATGATQAQQFPDKPIRLIVPFGPAGSADVVARLISEKLGQALGTPVVVENKPGADGIVGMQYVAAAKPDGYTLLLNVGSAHTLTPVLNKASPNPITDFEPVSLISKLGFVIVVNEKFPAKTFPEYVAYARANQAKTSMSAGSSGVALMSEKFKKAVGIPDAVVASYKGPGYTAVLSGEVDMTIDGFNSMSLIKAGKLRPLALLSPKRNPIMPEVPTLDELGVKGMNFASWAGLLAPAGTPKPVIARLHSAVAAIMADPVMVKRFGDYNHEVVAGTPVEFAAQIAADLKEWQSLVQSTGYRVQ